MLPLRKSNLIGKPRQYLTTTQREINNIHDYSLRVTSAKNKWKNKNKAHFEQIRETLISICHGTRRCHYCEDSAADEVEHVWPKAFYPERAFRWSNYIFSCGPCNGSFKGDNFDLIDENGDIIKVTRKKDDPITPPPEHDPLFIDPTIEDPLEYIILEPITGIFLPLSENTDSIEYKKAEYTITTLGLNKRDFLSKARRMAYQTYLDLANKYIERKDAGASRNELTKRLEVIRESPHPTVWHEVKRLADTGVEHQELFTSAPELNGTF
ncbi:hypothetical protein PSH28_18520 [Pseudomonas resinovorans]|uniref:hypothetical protein n=1 Tax=Metapseudomonas resinovorans TaxID=53412 RepID=UPI00237F5D8A|nr:hypothetical protein [Pseudomonas resinovorans]MDE3738603.1 hypothetical protein [Pseudomonas resinovorans]